jgi:lipopolysaccharide transport system ATP-binding protein
MSTAIEFNNISKQYRLGLVSTRTLSHDLNRWWQTAILHKEDPYLKIGSVNDRSKAADSEYVWALKNIDFKVEQGDVVGVIGKNGAGKSTLLKLLSKVTGPTTGTIKAKGRIASLLEVGTGFHSELTGRENIFMNGAILGMSKHEINKKIDEIVAFSGCERYIDTPVKRYSSGMTVRLGFAVAAHLDPEILVVDEVLAVGDAEFQKKAIGKMKDVSQGEGRTVLFVSHNMASIRSLCKTGVLLDNGMVAFRGTAAETVDLYLNDNRNIEESIEMYFKVRGNRLEIKDFSINGLGTNYIKVSPTSNELTFEVRGNAKDRVKLALEARLYDNNNVLLGVFSPSHMSGITNEYFGDFVYKETLKLPNNINKGQYLMSVALTHPNVEYLAKLNTLVIIESEGIIGKSGLDFDYSGSGFMMFDSAL